MRFRESNVRKFQNKYRVDTIRLKGYDYSQNGFYFVTICTKNREHYFGRIINGQMRLSKIGQIARQFWLEIPVHFSFVVLDQYIVMPNHVHGIIVIDKNNNDPINVSVSAVETRQCLVSTDNTNRWQNQGKNTISSIIGSYKSICTKTINRMQQKIFFQWQPRFYDHIIRNEKSLNRIRQYIRNNPIKWYKDRNNLNNLYM